MEFLSFLLLIVILVLIVNFRNRLNDLKEDIQELKYKLTQHQPGSTDLPKAKESVPVTEKPRPGAQEAPPKPVESIPALPKDEWVSAFKRVDEPAEAIPNPTRDNTKPKPGGESMPVVEETNETSFFDTASFFERHPDLEKFIGENLVSKIGIVILVIAIGFFVKYAIDQNWIGPVGRVGIGIICGGLLVGLAHRLNKNYRAFSSVLTGGGLAVLYFTITLAFQQFQLFGQVTAFIIMVVITIFSVVLSLLYDKQEVAVLALIGGFATPFMASRGDGNYQALFTYLLILNTGLLALSIFKSWRLLNVLAFVFTVVLYGGWLFSLSDAPIPTYRNGFLFATAFYLLFFAINVIHNIKQNKQFLAFDFGIILANTALFFAASLYCLSKANLDEFRGVLCVSLAVFNLAASLFFFRNRKVDTNVLYLLIGITLTFISLAAPVQLKGNHITLFWACETVLLYWLYQKSQIRLTQISALIIWCCMLVSLFMDWQQLYFSYPPETAMKMPVIINKAFIASIFCSISTALLFLLRKKEKAPDQSFYLVPPSIALGVAALILLYVGGALEINYQFEKKALVQLYLPLYTFSFILVFLFILERQSSFVVNWWFKLSLLILCVLIYLVNTTAIFQIQRTMVDDPSFQSFHFTAHWIAALLLALIFYRLGRYSETLQQKLPEFYSPFTWTLCIIVVVYLSIETHLVVNAFLIESTNDIATIHTQFIKIGLPILWAFCSFALMWIGMHFERRIFRIISLVLFAVTLFKLFIFDIRNISEGGKIAAFFCLGIILLIVSFMYQRLKKIIIHEEKQ